MNRETKDLIQSRALRLAPFLADYLQHEDPADWEKGQAYKFCWLLLKGPRSFKEQFHFSDMRLCWEAIESVYFSCRDELPGPSHLLGEEKAIVRDHNIAAAEYQARQEQRPPTTAYAERMIGLMR